MSVMISIGPKRIFILENQGIFFDGINSLPKQIFSKGMSHIENKYV